MTRTLGALPILAGCALLAVHLGLPGVGEALTYLLPAALLLGLLATRRYPGERALLAALRRPFHRARSRAAALPTSRRATATLPRGGRLIATSLAVRPPPAALAFLSA